MLMGLTLSACGGDDDDDPKVSFSNQTMYNGDTYTITNGETATWESSNSLIASVSGNVVTAFCAGTATISSELGSFTVTVQTKLNSYYEPYLNWGASASSVKSYMSGYSELSSSSDALIYSGKGVVDYYVYSFESSLLKSSACVIPVASINAETLANFLIERYFPVSYDDDKYYFISPDQNTAVLMQITKLNNTYCYFIVYAGLSSSKASIDKTSLVKDIDVVAAARLYEITNALK